MNSPPQSTVRAALGVCAFALASAACPPLRAETLRCTGGSAGEGDSRVSVIFKCGQPLLKDSFCAPLYQGHSLQPVPEPWASTVLPCQTIEEWLYDRGPGNMAATLRFRSGVLQSIRYSRSPR
jgi:Protein of unknown function (DUF2845)